MADTFLGDGRPVRNVRLKAHLRHYDGAPLLRPT
jgi:hypothetical protein